MQRLDLREQGNPLTQQHGRHLHDEMADHVVLQQGLQMVFSPTTQILRSGSSFSTNVTGSSAAAVKPGAVELAMGEGEVLGGGIRRSGIIELRDLIEGAAAHQRDVHARVELIVGRLLRRTGFV